MRVIKAAADTVGYSSAQTSTREIELPHADNTMIYELADFIEAVGATQAGTPLAEAPCGPFGMLAHFHEVTLASLALMDGARRTMGVAFPADE